MELTLIINSTISVLTLGGLIFAVFFFFKNPQTNLEKKQALNEERDKGKTPKNEFELLRANFEWDRAENDKNFCKLEKQIVDAFGIANNHTNTVDTKVDKLIQSTNLMSNKITELSTIINERIPKKV